MNFGHDDDLLIPLAEGDKVPLAKFGGWPVDAEHDNVFTRAEARQFDHEWWALIRSAGGRRLVLDVDTSELGEEYHAEHGQPHDDVQQVIHEIGQKTVDHERAGLVESPSHGYHVHVDVQEDTLEDAELLRGTTYDDSEYVERIDVKGEVAKGYVLDPEFCPGYDVKNWPDDDLTTWLPSFLSNPEPIVKRASESTGTYDGPDKETGSIHAVWGGVPEGQRVAHPVHGSSSNSNFMVDPGGKTARCWRHEHTFNAMQAALMETGRYTCGEVRDKKYSQDELYEAALEIGVIDLSPKEIPLVRSADRDEKLDALAEDRARAKTRKFFASDLDGGHVFISPQAMGKTTVASQQAKDYPTMLITANKDEHRETAKRAASEAGASWDEVINFKPDHEAGRPGCWLWDNAPEPQKSDIRDLYAMGFAPRIILSKYQHLIPEHVVDPYSEQFGEDNNADLMMGSPGHEGMETFNTYGEDTPRRVIYDDVQPLAEQVTENSFTLGDYEYGAHNARPELDTLVREIDAFESNTLDELLNTPAELADVEHLAIGDPDEVSDPEDNIWEELERRADLDEAIRVDLPDIALRSELVDGSTLEKLKCVCDVDRRETEWVRWTEQNNDETIRMYSWYRVPDLRDHSVVVTSATPVPHVAEFWCEATCGSAEVTHATDNPEAVRRAQDILVVQTSHNSNSRSGGQANKHRTELLADAIERVEGERPGVVDAKRMRTDHGLDGMNFARTWSNNELGEKQVGLVAGSTYYGDSYVLGLAAAIGERTHIQHEDGQRARATTEIGSDLLRFMRQAPISQAITRFGRVRGKGATVYVDTDYVPEGFPTVDVTDKVHTATKSEAAAVEAIRQGRSNYKQLANAIGVTRQQARNIVAGLVDRDVVRVEEGSGACGGDRIAVDSSIELNMLELPETSYSYRGIRQNGLDEVDADEESSVQLTLDDVTHSLDPPS